MAGAKSADREAGGGQAQRTLASAAEGTTSPVGEEPAGSRSAACPGLSRPTLHVARAGPGAALDGC